MSLDSLLFVLSIHALALISPGPDFAVVTRLSIVSGRQTGLWAAAGVASAIGVYVLICALGLSLVLAALPGLSRLLAIVGTLYLGWLGVQCLRSRGALPEAQAAQAGGRAFVTGFLTNLLNPKAMLYFGSILSQVLTPELGHAETALIGILLVGESLLWFGLVASLFSSPQVLNWLRHRMVWFERCIGAVLLALAAKLASSTLR
ncbi:LysE family translocator [Uliginosibacterium sp. 31-12]|uniref:LysE family translocator n=1 Tax=Uliginosibacterium sp. 31-12 TaxID=3062781 RepID=UPI0026E2E74C|nr:LysE family transporter [Uliginosibacterium sp. 31-12]MDO6386521.1 LysE family transporter [Uliginosibacterium sp. 31-12]